MNSTQFQRNVALAAYTTYKIGGPADFFVSIHTQKQLIQTIECAQQNRIPYLVLGLGANILVSDKGFRGLVIHNQTNSIRISKNVLTADSGVLISDLINLTQPQGLSGFEHFAGIPSTVGGAIWQNLHFLTPDRQSTFYIADIIKSATLLNKQGKIIKVNKDFLQFGYDDSILHHQPLTVIDVTFSLSLKDPNTIKQQVVDNLAWRNEKQPQLSEYPSCGSVFKKIAGVGAGRLIDQAGLKGKTIGRVQISPKHANYLINLGGAKASHVKKLISLVQKTVKQKTDYNLQPEIVFVGEF